MATDPGTRRGSAEKSDEQQTEVCERCGRDVEEGQAYRVRVSYPSGLRTERLLCVFCAREVRRYLFETDQIEGEHEPPAQPEAPQPPPARLGWFLARMTVYGLIAAGVFALVTWLSLR